MIVRVWSCSIVSHELLTSISGLSRESHECVRVQLPCLVILSLNDGRASHYGLGCGHNDEVLASDTQENLPSKHRVSAAFRCIGEQYILGTYMLAMS